MYILKSCPDTNTHTHPASAVTNSLVPEIIQATYLPRFLPPFAPPFPPHVVKFTGNHNINR